MSYHIVSIDAPRCVLSARDGQLICRSEEGERRLPLEDVAAIIVTSFSATFHGHLLVQAAKNGVALILCETFRPASLVLPANRATDTLLTRAVLSLSAKSREQLWAQTIHSKCRNQWTLAKAVAAKDPHLESLRITAQGRHPRKESTCARLYWSIIGRELGEESFIRERKGGGLNHLLNYGYAVLLSSMLQKLFAVGLDPTFGLFHAVRERSTPLAYDLMEPFRVCVERRVIEWARKNRRPWEVTPDYRRWVTSFGHDKVGWRTGVMEVQNVMEGVIRSFRRAVLADDVKFYHPWTSTNSKWAG